MGLIFPLKPTGKYNFFTTRVAYRQMPRRQGPSCSPGQAITCPSFDSQPITETSHSGFEVTQLADLYPVSHASHARLPQQQPAW